MMEDEIKLPEEPDAFETSTPGESMPRGRLLMRVAGIILIALAVLLAVYGTVAYVAWQQGQSERDENARRALQEEIVQQMDFTRQDISNGNFALAIRRLDWILERDPGNPNAAALRLQAEASLNARLTPTAMPTTTPARLPLAEEQGPTEAEMAQAFADLEQTVKESDWEMKIAAIVEFQAQFPAYRRRETDTLLYDAYVNRGIELLQGEQVEQGLFYLSQAERLGDLPAEAEDYRIWAELYLSGIGYFGVDWGTTIYFFRDLCAAAPFYQNACSRLHVALVAYADQYAANLDWCPAESFYAEAVRIDTDEVLNEKLSQAQTSCSEATPTPPATITGTVPFADTPPAVDGTQE